ncbi:replication protein ori43, partial [Bacillus sp. ZZQ-131]
KGRNARTYITTRSVLLKSNKHNFKAFLLGKLAFNEEIESATLEVQFQGRTSEAEANKNSENKRSGPGG